MGRLVSSRWRLRAIATAALAGLFTLTAAAPAWSDDTPADAPPVVSSTGLTDGQLVPYEPQFYPAVSDDGGVVKVVVLLNGTDYTDFLSHCQLSIDRWHCLARMNPNYFPDDTDVTVTVQAFDAAGQMGSLSSTVHIDSTAPLGTLSPRKGLSMRSGPVAMSFSDVSADTVKIEMTKGLDGVVLATDTSAPWDFNWVGVDKAVPPCFAIVDRAGNVTSVCSHYIVDDDAPVIQQISLQADDVTSTFVPGTGWSSGGGWAGGVSDFYPVIKDASGIARLDWLVDGVLSSNFGNLEVNAATIKTPTVTVELRVTDAAGNASATSFVVNIDNAGPAMTVSPAEHTLVRGSTFATSVKAADPHGVGYTNLQGSDSQPAAVTSAKLKAGKDGTRAFTWTGVDKLGNSTNVRRTVIVDNTAPAVSISKAPANNAKLSAKFTVTASASDHNGVAKVQLLVNGKVVATDSKAAFGFTVNPKSYGKSFTVQLRAYDKAGNLKLSSKRNYRR